MGYSEKEFFHTLPTAIGDYQFARDGERVTITHPERDHQLLLNVAPLPDRVLGLIRVPRVDVRFSFSKFTTAERDQFMALFEQSFQRGGG